VLLCENFSGSIAGRHSVPPRATVAVAPQGYLPRWTSGEIVDRCLLIPFTCYFAGLTAASPPICFGSSIVDRDSFLPLGEVVEAALCGARPFRAPAFSPRAEGGRRRMREFVRCIVYSPCSCIAKTVFSHTMNRDSAGAPPLSD